VEAASAVGARAEAAQAVLGRLSPRLAEPWAPYSLSATVRVLRGIGGLIDGARLINQAFVV